MNEQFLAREQLQSLLDVLHAAGYSVMGPRVEQAAIVYDRIDRVTDLPVGLIDEQAPGHYRLVSSGDQRVFAHVVGPHSWKKVLFPPTLPLLRSHKTEQGWQCEQLPDPVQKIACLGIRACELAAIGIQDRVFIQGEYCDPTYASRRSNLLLIAVNCTRAAATCFCTSMDTGPRVTHAFDLALTEIPSGFLVECGTTAGQTLCDQLPLRPATCDELSQAEGLRQNAVEQISRRLDSQQAQQMLPKRMEHARWDEVAERCLSCANCTLVCPTCFCHSVEEITDLTDQSVVRQRQWDSCFNFDFSHIAGGAVRPQIRSRYRQWLTHKLSTWVDQFGTSGCVGCGRCITWCPVGIDITEEVAALCQSSIDD